MPHDLENDIQRDWSRANTVLFTDGAHPAELTALASNLRHYAAKVRSAGLSGERELLWLADRLESRTDDSHGYDHLIA